MTQIWNEVKKLPAKGYNWEGLIGAIKARYFAECAERRHVNRWEETEAEIATGMRGKRLAVTSHLVWFAKGAATRVSHHAPSEESLAWGETYGTTNIWTCEETLEAETAKALQIIAAFR